MLCGTLPETSAIRSMQQSDTGQTMVMTQTDQTLLDTLGYTIAGAPAPAPVPTPTSISTPSPTQAEFNAASTMLLGGSTRTQFAMTFMQDPKCSTVNGADVTNSSFVRAAFAEAHIPVNASVEMKRPPFDRLPQHVMRGYDRYCIREFQSYGIHGDPTAGCRRLHPDCRLADLIQSSPRRPVEHRAQVGFGRRAVVGQPDGPVYRGGDHGLAG
jgi:hypothetical protein